MIKKRINAQTPCAGFMNTFQRKNAHPGTCVVYRLGDSEQQMFCFGSYYSVRIVLGGRGVSSGRVGTVAMTYSPIPTAPRATYFSHQGRLLSKRLQMTTVITRAIVRYFAVFRMPLYSCQSSASVQTTVTDAAKHEFLAIPDKNTNWPAKEMALLEGGEE